MDQKTKDELLDARDAWARDLAIFGFAFTRVSEDGTQTNIPVREMVRRPSMVTPMFARVVAGLLVGVAVFFCILIIFGVFP